MFQVCCGKSYRDNYEFKRHTREFHATGYACDFCPHVDTRRKGLERHLATHARNAGALGPAAALGHHYQRLEHFETRATTDGGSSNNRGQATPIDYSSSVSHLATPTSTMERASSPADAAASDSSSSSASSEGGDERDTSEGGVVVMVADSSVNHNHNSQRGGDHLPA